jgi:hypothetical protein
VVSYPFMAILCAVDACPIWRVVGMTFEPIDSSRRLTVGNVARSHSTNKSLSDILVCLLSMTHLGSTWLSPPYSILFDTCVGTTVGQNFPRYKPNSPPSSKRRLPA